MDGSQLLIAGAKTLSVAGRGGKVDKMLGIVGSAVDVVEFEDDVGVVGKGFGEDFYEVRFVGEEVFEEDENGVGEFYFSVETGSHSLNVEAGGHLAGVGVVDAFVVERVAAGDVLRTFEGAVDKFQESVLSGAVEIEVLECHPSEGW